MHDDDRPTGRLLSRRELMALVGVSGLGWLAGCRPGSQRASLASNPDVPGCVVRPEQTQGPYFVEEALQRSDLRLDPSDGTRRPGTPLGLTFAVSRLRGRDCTPLAAAVVDVWHCDALGVYSDVRDPHFDTTGKKFLRGHQMTGSDGIARFITIYPGWYPGRTVHIHFKIRSDSRASSGHEFTSQLYFDDDLTDRVHAHDPYASKGQRDLRNDADGIFADGGSRLMLSPTDDGRGGYAARFDVALQI